MFIFLALLMAIFGPVIGVFGVAIHNTTLIEIGKLGLAVFTCFFIDHIIITIHISYRNFASRNVR